MRTFTVELQALDLRLDEDRFGVFSTAIFRSRALAGPVIAGDRANTDINLLTCIDLPDHAEMATALATTIRVFERAARTAGVRRVEYAWARVEFSPKVRALERD